MADDLPPGYRPCLRCGRGTVVRARLANPDTGERERVVVCLKCALKGRSRP
jgi:hypothetical protein